jgi:serine/threonine protein kinase
MDLSYKKHETGKFLGNGSYGNVHEIKVKDLETPTAVKLINTVFPNEITILTRIRHPNLMPALGYTFDGTLMGIVMPKMKPLRIIDLDLETKKRFFIQICLGLHKLHSENFVHLDLKIENIMVDSSGNAVITDFGSCEMEDCYFKKRNYLPTTISYRCPEVWFDTFDNKVKKSFDIWALGIIYRRLFFDQNIRIFKENLRSYSFGVIDESSELYKYLVKIDKKEWYSKEFDMEMNLMRQKHTDAPEWLYSLTSIDPDNRPTIETVISYLCVPVPEFPPACERCYDLTELEDFFKLVTNRKKFDNSDFLKMFVTIMYQLRKQILDYRELFNKLETFILYRKVDFSRDIYDFLTAIDFALPKPNKEVYEKVSLLVDKIE